MNFNYIEEAKKMRDDGWRKMLEAQELNDPAMKEIAERMMERADKIMNLNI